MFTKKEKKNNLDERQEQIMLQIEHAGCWIAYWGLLISILVQEIVYRGDFHYIVGEWIVFFILCIYVLTGCIKNGLWDRHIKPTMKNNVIASLIGAGVIFLFTFLMIIRNFPDKPVGAVAAGLISAAVVFVLCLIALSAAKRATEKKQEELEKEDPEEDE
ncbi:MAG: hypothetical protein II474_03785 [Firmicutes bacterium]|jgi:hypothetical protein|nr:hypothetical protein [Bacillota bacterium]